MNVGGVGRFDGAYWWGVWVWVWVYMRYAILNCLLNLSRGLVTCEQMGEHVVYNIDWTWICYTYFK